jgi:CheY-like chemotaxis protein
MKISGPILLIDDDEDDHELFRTVCEKLGVCQHLVHFDNGLDVLKFLKSNVEIPFVIMCDINMPRMNGMELRRILYEDDYLKNKAVPFIFFSTSASAQQVREAYDLTVQGFFIKGTSYKETETTFRRILEYWSDCRHPNSLD